MTKQRNKIYYVIIILLSILEIIAAIGSYAAHYFTKTRMGMLRHVVYLNGKWEKLLPIPALKWMVVLIVIILIIFAYVLYKKNKKHSVAAKMLTVITISISFWTVYYIIFYNTGMNRAYYILSFCFITLTMLQHILYYCFYSMEKNKFNRKEY